MFDDKGMRFDIIAELYLLIVLFNAIHVSVGNSYDILLVFTQKCHEMSAFVFDVTTLWNQLCKARHCGCVYVPRKVLWLWWSTDRRKQWSYQEWDICYWHDIHLYASTYISKIAVYIIRIHTWLSYIYYIIGIPIGTRASHTCISWHLDVRFHRWLELRCQRPPGKTTSPVVCCRSPGHGGGWFRWFSFDFLGGSIRFHGNLQGCNHMNIGQNQVWPK